MGLETLRFCTGNDEKCCTLVYIMSPEKILKKCTPLCMANKGRGGGGGGEGCCLYRYVCGPQQTFESYSGY